MTPRRTVSLLALLLILVVPAGLAIGRGTSKPHEDFGSRFTSRVPGHSTGVRVAIKYKNPSDPNGTPSAVRKVVLAGPPGTRIDTSVPARCTATDDQLKMQGESACPAGSRVGSGTIVAAVLVAPGPNKPRTTFDVNIFNTDGGLLMTARPQGSSTVGAVARGTIKGRTTTVTVPTCLMGGQPPNGCASDQTALVTVFQRTFRIVRGPPGHRRAYLTTPRTCPRSHHWTGVARLTYADGASERVTATTGCLRPRR